MEQIAKAITSAADFIGGVPLFVLLIGGGLYMLIRSGLLSIRRLPYAIKVLREKSAPGEKGQISSAQALAGVVAATIGLGNIAGVAIALVLGGPGAIFWMWISAIVGMSTKFHEGTLAIMYRGKSADGTSHGGTMYIIEQAFSQKWKWAASFFAVAGMFGTLCIMNANQLTEAFMSVCYTPLQGHEATFKLFFGIAIALIVALVVLKGITRIAKVASFLVPFMVGAYFMMVLYIIGTHIEDVPGVFQRIFAEAFNLKAGFGALAGIAMIGARRAMVVNDAGVGTATIMHGHSRCTEPVREGLVAMLGPAIDSGLVCTLTALAILLCGDINVEGVKGLQVAMGAFANGIPYGEYLLMLIVACFALSSMFSYSFYGTRCAAYLFGEKKAKYYTWAFILTLVVFAVIPVEAAVGLCDLFYALMAIPTMLTLIILSKQVRRAAKEYFSRESAKDKSARSTSEIECLNPD